MFIRFIATFLWLALCGCAGHTVIYVAPPKIVASVLPTTPKCEPYAPPTSSVAPPAPLAAYADESAKKESQRIAILLEYIRDLRVHIATTNRQNAAAYQQYLSRCIRD